MALIQKKRKVPKKVLKATKITQQKKTLTIVPMVQKLPNEELVVSPVASKETKVIDMFRQEHIQSSNYGYRNCGRKDGMDEW